MKKAFISVLFLGLLFSFVSCGSDDPEKVEKSFNGVCKQTVDIKAYANASTTIPTITSTLDDMLKNSAGYGSPIASGSLVVAGSETSVKIDGLENMADGVILKDFKLTINGLERNFGNVTKDNVRLYTDQHLDYFKNVFNKMVSEGKLVTKISFTPSVDIDAADKVKLQIAFDGKFSYFITL